MGILHCVRNWGLQWKWWNKIEENRNRLPEQAANPVWICDKSRGIVINVIFFIDIMCDTQYNVINSNTYYII